MKRQNNTNTPHPENSCAFGKQGAHLVRPSLLTWVRLVVGLVANISVVLWVVPKFAGTKWKAADLFLIAIPLIAVIILIPVIWRGRDVARLVAIGLCVLPAYIFLQGCMAIVEFWSK